MSHLGALPKLFLDGHLVIAHCRNCSLLCTFRPTRSNGFPLLLALEEVHFSLFIALPLAHSFASSPLLKFSQITQIAGAIYFFVKNMTDKVSGSWGCPEKWIDSSIQLRNT